MVKRMTNKSMYDIKSKDISFKDRKNDRDKLISNFNMDENKPIDKNDINEVLNEKTSKFKELPINEQKVVKKEIELELLYNYNEHKLPVLKKKKHNYYIYIFLILVFLCVLGIYFIVK